MLETLLFSLVLLVTATVLVYIHLREWRQAQLEDDAEQLDFQWRQFRRRMQASAMVAIIGLLLPITSLVRTPVVMTVFVIGLLILVGWIIVLAGADFIAARHRLMQLETDRRIAEAKAEQQRRRHEES